MPYRSQSRRPRKPLRQNPVALKQARQAAGMTQLQLAERADISPSFVSELESGERGASVETLERVAKVLQIPVSMLERPKSHRCPRCTYRFDEPTDGRIPVHQVRSTGQWCRRGGTALRPRRAA